MPQLRDDTEVEEHLEAALETAEDSQTRYHVRQALQRFYLE